MVPVVDAATIGYRLVAVDVSLLTLTAAVVADSVPPVNDRPDPTVTLLKPPEPLP